MARPNPRLQASAQRYLNRRLEHALRYGPAHSETDIQRAPALSVAVGIGLTAVGAVGCLVFSLVRPPAELPDAPILMERRSGALYVRIEDTVHPVLNLTSARLIAGRADDPEPVSDAALETAKYGVQVGIPGAPARIGVPLDDTRWTVCDSGSTAAIAGAGQQLPEIADPVLVAGPTGTAYLLYAGQRAALDPADPAVARALGLSGITARPVSATLLNLIPEVVPIAVPRIPGAGNPATGALAGLSVGDVIRVQRASATEYFVVLDGGVQRIGPVAADLIRAGGLHGATAVPTVSEATLRAVPTLAVLPTDTYPERPAQMADHETLCATWIAGDVTLSTGDQPPLPEGHATVRLASADGAGPALDEVYVAPGRSVYVRPDGSGSTTGSLVAGTGVRFAIPDAGTARVLGLPDIPAPAPAAVLAALPAGPVLDRQDALLGRDVITTGPSQSGER